MRLFRFLLLAIALACPAVAQAAESSSTRAKPGQRVMVGHFSSWNNDCSPGQVPWVTITKKPTHGVLETELGPYRIDSVMFGRTTCIGKTVKGLYLYYTANNSYQGSDLLEYHVDFSPSRTQDFSVTIQVGGAATRQDAQSSRKGTGKR